MSTDSTTPNSELPAVDDVTFPPEVYAEIEAAADVGDGILTAADLSGAHPELPTEWARSMASIRNEGGPWWCSSCDGPSMLCYRCSRCGRDLAGDTTTQGRQPG